MNSLLRAALLILVDVTLVFLIIGILPFAWILRDGLGPDSIQSSGPATFWKFLMTFYVGPGILLFGSFDLLLRTVENSDKSKARKGTILRWLAIIVAISALSMVFVESAFRPQMLSFRKR